MNQRSNTAETVAEVVRILTGAGQDTALFGGWAEEALRVAEPRPHRDIDLLLLSDDFAAVDAAFRSRDLPEEVVGKRFHHKRAFLFGGVLVELYLVRREGDGWITDFWGEIAYRWLRPLHAPGRLGGRELRVATAENLSAFRLRFRDHEPWRWKDPASLVAPSGL